jgi:hypothetical protein
VLLDAVIVAIHELVFPHVVNAGVVTGTVHYIPRVAVHKIGSGTENTERSSDLHNQHSAVEETRIGRYSEIVVAVIVDDEAAVAGTM